MKSHTTILTLLAVALIALACTESPAVSPPSPTADPIPAERPASPEPTPSPTPMPSSSPVRSEPHPNGADTADNQEMSAVPPAIGILSPAYREAYRLLPDGEWARKYYAREFAYFDAEAWPKLNDTQPAATSMTIELNAADEFNLMRVLRDEDAHTWVVEKIRELDGTFGQEFAAAETPDDRLDVLRRMVTATGIDPTILYAELFTRWEGKKWGADEDTLDRIVANQRQAHDIMQTMMQLSEKDGMIRTTELRVCQFLMSHVVGAKRVFAKVFKLVLAVGS